MCNLRFVSSCLMVALLLETQVATAARFEMRLDQESWLNRTGSQACRWGERKCCCAAPDKSMDHVQCKQWLTGMVDGAEVCSCSDVTQKLGFKTSHAPRTWRTHTTVNWGLQWNVGSDTEPYVAKMDALCAVESPLAFESEQPAGSCTEQRLFNFAPETITSSCKSTKLSETKELRDKLENSELLKSFDPRIAGSSLMGCVSLGAGCVSGGLGDKVIEMAIDNLDTDFLSIGPAMRDKIMGYARDMMKAETDVDDDTSSQLLDWAFFHREGENPYCNPEEMQAHRDLLVKGLTAADPDHSVDETPWKYGEEIYGPFKKLLEMTIDGMFTADCVKEKPAEVSLEQARGGQGVVVSLTEEQRYAMLGEIDAATAQRDFLVAHAKDQQLKAWTVADALKGFSHVPLIDSTIQYVQKPILEHPIEANEAEVVRESLRTLGTLLGNETFLGHVSRYGAFDAWPMPPELKGLWATTKAAKYGERIWPDSLIDKLKRPSKSRPHCNCTEIEEDLGMHMLNQLPEIGLDFGHVSRAPDGKLTSDKITETLQHVDVDSFARTMVMVEAGIQDPILAVKYIVAAIRAGAEATGSSSGAPDVSASGKVKGVLVGLPIVQNLWAMLYKDEVSHEVFAQKMKWFFVANIVWAVWHAIEKSLPPEDIVLGLLTIALSTLSSFKYDGHFITFSNSKEFTDQMLAVYTVWNYRFVKQWASNENPADQWMHVSVALTMPIIEALVNHGDVNYYINYRRDDLFHSMLLMLDRQLKSGEQGVSRCCCDLDSDPNFFDRMALTFTMKSDFESMLKHRTCAMVPQAFQTKSKKCPAVKEASWPLADEDLRPYIFSKNGGFQLQHDPTGCALDFVPDARITQLNPDAYLP